MPAHRDSSPLGRLPLWATPLIYGALHAALVAVGLQVQISRPSVAAFWPASGLALAALLLLPRRHWAGILIALCVAEMTALQLLQPGMSGEGRGLHIALSAVVEAVAGAWLVQRLAGNPVDFSDVRRTLTFIAVVTATTLAGGALVAVPFTAPPFTGDFTGSLQGAWIANLLGTLIVAPLLLAFGRQGVTIAGRDGGQPPPDARITLAAFATLTALLAVVFLRTVGASRLPIDLPYIVYPALLWIVAIGGTLRVTLAILLTVLFQAAATRQGLGPFAHGLGPGVARPFEVQTFLGLIALPMLLASATLLQLRRSTAAFAGTVRREQNPSTQQRRLAGELMKRDELMRRKIAADLHNGPAQSLVAAQIEMSLLGRDASTATRDFSLLRKAIESATTEVRALMSDLAPAGLSEPRVGAGIGELARHFGRTRGITVEATDDGQSKPLDPDSRILLYQCVGELLRNAVKHGQTAWIGIRTHVEGDQIVVEVEDRGAGFEIEALDALPGDGGGFGLYGIRERLCMLRGAMRIRSSPGSGTLVALTLPMEREAT